VGRKGARSLVVLAVAGLVLAGCSESRTTSSGVEASGSRGATACAKDLLGCARPTTIGSHVPKVATKATGTPITIGMINQDNTPAASFPELSQADQAGVDFVNAELGGIDGHPIKLEVCNTKFSPEGSTACGQRFATEGVPAVLGGIDVFGNGIDTLAQNDIPYVGGIPVSTQSMTSPNSFQWSGGSWGPIVAFAHYAATTLKAKKVSILYGDFGSIADSARYGERTLKKLGVSDVQMIGYPITAVDLSSPIQAAAATTPDAVILLAADTGCAPAFDAVKTAGIKGQIFYVGACAVPSIVAKAGRAKTDGAIFNVEGPIDRKHPNADTVLYTAVINTYGKGLDPIGAGTVSFRAFMNLYRVMADIGAKNLSAATITKALASQRNAPSFMGHTSTCDHKQLAGLPAACSPQQILARMNDLQLEQIGTWVDVGKIYGTS
jgi:branched-chain amino acid transport system substrate-binding protein